MTLSKKEIEKLRKDNPNIVIPDKDINIDSFNTLLKKSYDNEYKTIKPIKKELGLKDADIAEMFVYKNAVSYRNSERRPHIESGIEGIYNHTIKKNRI